MMRDADNFNISWDKQWTGMGFYPGLPILT